MDLRSCSFSHLFLGCRISYWGFFQISPDVLGSFQDFRPERIPDVHLRMALHRPSSGDLKDRVLLLLRTRSLASRVLQGEPYLVSVAITRGDSTRIACVRGMTSYIFPTSLVPQVSCCVAMTRRDGTFTI
ncbi:hypothetical protein Salat_0686600 [Sesamum alatum]|uniref:Uncharacterized protein n=1 Tax=Sesamum alatum TaxID=300844 RepID=A0AAE1YSH3_9LAMI|nr:hypothetical protein Salat_0686600 [Sesamum alatum]